MSAIRLVGFLGEIPALNRAYLQDQNAQDAVNIALRTPSLRVIKGPLEAYQVTTQSTPTSFYKYNSTWFEFTEFTNFAESPVANEQFDRVYFSNSSGPWVTSSAYATAGAQPYPAVAYRPGVPTPSTAPSCVVGGTGSGANESRFYVYTAINTWGEPGPPSPPSALVTLQPGQYVDLTLTAVSAGSTYAPIIGYHIYRSNTLGTGYQYVGNTSSTTFQDNVDLLGEELPSETWDPPDTDIEGFTNLSNGIVAAFRGNELLLCEPGLPHAWPAAYRHSVDYPIVALSAVSSGVAILTEGQPYLALGIHPQSMVPVRLEQPFACVSARGVVSFGDNTVYPSVTGLVRINHQGAELLTREVMTLEDYQEFRPSTFIGFNWRDHYAAFYTDSAGDQLGFTMNPNSPQDGIVRFYGISVSGTYVDPGTALAYISSGNAIAYWDAGVPIEARWKSKLYELPYPQGMTCAQCFAEAYPVVMTVYRDDTVQCVVRFNDNKPVRLPNSRLGRRYEVEINSVYEVREVIVASAMEQLTRV